MALLVWIAAGLVVALIASLVARARRREALGNAVGGALGAVAAGFLGAALQSWDTDAPGAPDILVAAVGAAVALLILRSYRRDQPFA